MVHEQYTSESAIKHFEVPDYVIAELGLPELPIGYGFIGGAARAVAQKILFGEITSIRDIDLVAFEEYNPDVQLADELGRTYMPDDYAYGHSVQNIGQQEYFKSRDITINEVAVVNGEVLMTTQCYNDLRDKVVRPTSYETYYYKEGDSDQPNVGPRTAVKCLLIASAVEAQFGVAIIEGINDESYEDIGLFYIALGLNKAFQYGPQVTRLFMRKLVEKDIINNEESENPYTIARELSDLLEFHFRGSDAAELLEELSRTPSSDLLGYFNTAEVDELYGHIANDWLGREEY